MGPDYSFKTTAEQASRSAMERLTSLVSGKQAEQQYGTLDRRPSADHSDAASDASDDDDDDDSYYGDEPEAEAAFSWVEYAIFTLLGVAMLWAWYVPPNLPPSTLWPVIRP